MIEVDRTPDKRIRQGDIYRDIDYFERVQVEGDEVTIQKISFPLVIVLTQDCDLEQDAAYYVAESKKPENEDKRLLSVIVAPLYNEDIFLQGEHLCDESINYKMQVIPKTGKKGKLTTQYRFLTQNEIPRYHYLLFDESVQIANSVIDFKHYFTVNVECLSQARQDKFVCKVSKLYRERICQRFANYLSRIGLPNMQ